VRFLIDNALPARISALLAAAGHDAVHVRDYEMQTASDEAILARALREDRIVVSADSDFAAILAAQQFSRPSFILFRNADLLAPEEYARTLLSTLAALAPDLECGCVAVFRAGRLRVRRLPISPP